MTSLISLQLMYMIYLLQIDSATWQHISLRAHPKHGLYQSRTSSLRPLLRMRAWRNERSLVKGNEDAGYEGGSIYIRFWVFYSIFAFLGVPASGCSVEVGRFIK